jgi:putative ABC transport system ATP-binding protein
MQPILVVENLTKSYELGGKSIDVLRGLELSLKSDETVAILGPSGSGKSTLLGLLTGMDRPTSGSIRFGGKELSSLSEAEFGSVRAENFSIVFQQFHLLNHLTALENIRLPLEILGRDTKAADDALVAVGLGHRRDHFPTQMSGGECQRVAIARAMVVKPKVLFADEPSGNLDSETGRGVMQLLFDLVKDTKTSMVLVTHNESLAERCSRQLRFRQGRLEAAPSAV